MTPLLADIAPMPFITAGLGAFLVIGLGILLYMLPKVYRKVDQGQALIINSIRGKTAVTFSGGIVLPVVDRAELMDISLKTIEIERRGADGLICEDNIRADIKVSFYVRVNKESDDVLRVAQSIGCKRASDQQTLETLFVAKFSEALKSAGKQMDFEQLYSERLGFKSKIIEAIGTDLNGYLLDDAAIDYLEQTPLKLLDPANILDSQGIFKITEITTTQRKNTNDKEQRLRMDLGRQNLEADKAVMAMDRERAETEATEQQTIATVKSQTATEIAEVRSVQKQKTDVANIKANETIELAEIDRRRQKEIKEKDRERAVAVKHEQVVRERELESIAREREVELQRISKEKALEEQRRLIAEEIRARIAVERNVAEEEENIKTLRATSEADRNKTVKVTDAEAEAEEQLVKDIKAAEATDKVAEFKARERLTLARSDMEATDMEAQARRRLAEAIQAETAAAGLAKARVEEANAVAREKLGQADANVIRLKMEAEAQGLEQKGLAKARVDEVQIQLIEKKGLAAASASRQQGTAEAEVIRARMEAGAAGKTADAEATRKLGLAEVEIERERLLAEASGKTADAEATQKLGLADVEIERQRLMAQAAGKAADAEATERQGLAAAVSARELGSAEAEVIRARLLAEAAGKTADAEATQKLGLADVEVERQRLMAQAAGKAADAEATERLGLAEAAGVRARLQAEATGLLEKAKALQAMEGSAQQHEEFRLQLEKDRIVELAGVEASAQTARSVAEAQARILGSAFDSADIKIIGGEGGLAERFSQVSGLGELMDGFRGSGQTAEQLVTSVLDGRLLGSPAVRSATVAAVLTHLMSKAEGPLREKLGSLLHQARELGIDETPAG